jgi:uncharacterized protein (TIGR03067 family)
MQNGLAIAVAFLVGTVSGVPKSAPAKESADDLRGTWVVERFEQDGERADREFIEGKLKFVFTADKFWTDVDDPDKDAVSYTLDPSHTPNRIDIQYEKDGRPVTRPGIYVLEGDTFKICYADTKRPAEFATKKESGDRQKLYVLKRVEQKKE